MDNRILIGDKLDLEKIETQLVNLDKNSEIYVSQVLDEGEAGGMYVAMPIKEGRVIPLGVGQKFYATFYTKSGLLRCQVEIVGRYKKDSLFLMEIIQITELEKVQRREYYRFDCRTPMEYRILGKEEREALESEEIYNGEDWELEWKKAVMLDLSGGGSCFVTSVHEKGDLVLQLRFDIEIEDKIEVVYVYGKLLRSQRNQNNNTIYDHHVKFCHMNQRVREKIIRYIFHEQRKKRSKQMGTN